MYFVSWYQNLLVFIISGFEALMEFFKDISEIQQLRWLKQSYNKNKKATELHFQINLNVLEPLKVKETTRGSIMLYSFDLKM